MLNEVTQKENGRLTEVVGIHKIGDVINGFPYLPRQERKKILLLSDDL